MDSKKIIDFVNHINTINADFVDMQNQILKQKEIINMQEEEIKDLKAQINKLTKEKEIKEEKTEQVKTEQEKTEIKNEYDVVFKNL